MGGALRAGDHILGRRLQTNSAQVVGNLVGTARGVVGDEELAAGSLIQRVRRALSQLMAVEHRPVQIQK